MCWAPLLLVGWLVTQHWSGYSPKTNLDGAVIEVQSCERGIGLDVKASTSGLYGLAAQYGLTTSLDGWTVTVTPKAGVAYVDHRVVEQASPGNFQVGGQLLFGRERWGVGAEYWHLSNAGLGRPNSGLDLVLCQVGWVF